MINSSSRKAADYSPKQEDRTTSEATKISKTAAAAAAAASSSSTTSWSRLKDPRIVRVSRAFGGKDRHSKVCTVRGLRDRRVRLSVPTAIQLYDLQDRLNLNQPSKVIDWLLNVAKDDIDQLPPLQMPPGDLFSQFHLPLISSTTNTNTSHRGLIAHDQDHVDSRAAEQSKRQLSNIGDWNDPLELSTSNYWSTNSDHMKSKEVDEEREANNKENWMKIRKQGDDHAYNISSNNFVTRASQYNPNSLTGLLNSVMPPAHNSSSFLRWDPSNLSLSPNEQDHPNHNFSFVPILPSTSLSIPSGSSHQFVVYPPTSGDFDPKQMINFQMLSSSTSTSQNSPMSNASFSNPPLYPIGHAMRSPFHLSMNPFGTGASPSKD